ncbi:MAG: hypothetical protein IT384_01430 [Deltaproteobacteria bacterium]|nr:hypothetical protein [Deltaproteobacteria bacterium]
MMSAPPRNPAGWAGEEMSNDDVVAPTRVTHQTAGARPSEPAPAVSAAVAGGSSRRSANDRQERAAAADRTLPPTDRGTQRSGSG